MRKLVTLLITIACVLTMAASSRNEMKADMDGLSKCDVIIFHDNTNKERNALLIKDLKYLKKELPRRHKNLFFHISKKKFNKEIDQLIAKVDQLDNAKIYTRLNQIIASIGDAHTTINTWDGYRYPLQFYIFNGQVCVVDADVSLKEMMNSQVTKIDGVDIDKITKELTTLIPHENEGWVRAMLPSYLQSPVYMYRLGLIKEEGKAVFTVEKDGKEKEFTVTAFDDSMSVDNINKKTKDVLIGRFDQYYTYQYIAEQKAVYFEYNICGETDKLKFADFNKELFQTIENNDTKKIIVDLRNNSGGNSEILNPFTQQLSSYIKKNPELKVYIIVGRKTFSSGMFAIYRIKESAPEAVSIGETTGGSLDHYGDIQYFSLPNSQMSLSYSTKHFEFSKLFAYKNEGVHEFLPDKLIQPTIQDYENGIDPVLEYAFAN